MHTDARTIETGSILEGDICIVGAGAAGISLALEWNNSGKNVILLEGGGFQVETEIQDLYRGKTTGQRYFPLQSARLHYFGGTTGHWSGFCSDFDPIDFEKRDWVPHSGWPIKRADLDPFYERAQKILDLGPYQYNLDYWKKKDDSLVPLPFDNQVIWNKVWQFSPPTRFGSKYKEEILKSKNIHLYSYANVTEIIADEQVQSVKELKVKNLAGKEHIVRAKTVVLACSSIQNARLLLASNSIAKNGLGNDHDQVGRYFMEHLEVDSGDLFLTQEAALKLYMWEFFTVKMRAELAVTKQMQEESKILNGTASLSPFTGSRPPAFIDTFSDDAKASVEKWENREKNFSEKGPSESDLKKYARFNLFTRMEQAPNPNSRVTLDQERDELGMPRVILNWELTPLEKRSIRKLYDLIGQQLGISGLGRVRVIDWLQDDTNDEWPSILGGGWHHMGTTRMHEDPGQGVVDANCKVHGISNLYIAGASCFSTGGAANPTLTLVALTLRLSDYLKSKV
ncbi:GMC family oxidoreductase [Algoriphagus sp. CAU 1675]|uniref:FAD-dependent oxidoreductase n=1 Tax=Algoriphagus sp. CAU 1675 TaxID=3032597 RepID=UPI0023DC6869|nr:GMC family oxidoreductase [Algoriphagus sp. CAU 1675]MDF2156697.1 GMC family oxidoreductase [Algoriphagus sp. CAU 1675]